uniref:Uncharacterized protein n=1 Tax=Populus trichocarpa TaxID=3694 RepID=A0A2K1WW55_POPTR
MDCGGLLKATSEERVAAPAVACSWTSSWRKKEDAAALERSCLEGGEYCALHPGFYQGDFEEKQQQGFYLALCHWLRLFCLLLLAVLLGWCGNAKIGSEEMKDERPREAFAGDRMVLVA